MANPIHENYLDKVDLRRGNKFHAVAQQIAQDIVSGKYEDRLPSVRELCELHGVTLVTMDKALKVLKANGLITVRHAKGMFVTRLKRKKTGRILFWGTRVVSIWRRFTPRLFQGCGRVVQVKDCNCCLNTMTENRVRNYLCFGIFGAVSR